MTAIRVSKLKEGYESAIENAERLLKAAQILNEHARYASSIQLSLLSCEASGKAYMIAECFSQGKDIKKSQWENRAEFFSHWKKLFKAEKAAHLSFDRELTELIEKHGTDKWLAHLIGTDPHKPTIQWKARRLKQSLTYLNYDFKRERWLKPSDMPIAIASFANGHLSSAKEMIKAVRQEGKKLGL